MFMGAFSNVQTPFFCFEINFIPLYVQLMPFISF